MNNEGWESSKAAYKIGLETVFITVDDPDGILDQHFKSFGAIELRKGMYWMPPEGLARFEELRQKSWIKYLHDQNC